VFDAELDVVRVRREAVGGNPDGVGTDRLVEFIKDVRFRDSGRYDRERPVDPTQDRWPLRPDGPIEGGAPRDEPAADGLVGLALSGGGIRSGATCLGAMQALDQCGVMRLVDYISSVSGGGYAAACLNANIAGVRKPDVAAAPPAPSPGDRTAASEESRRPFPPPPPGWIFPFPHKVGVRETVLFRYLRANAQYLVPRGRILEYSFAPVLLLRGLFLNLWALLPLVIVWSAITVGLLACPRLRDAGQAGEILATVAALLAVLWAVFFVINRPVRNLLEGHSQWYAWGLLLGAGVLIAIVGGVVVDRMTGAIAGAIVLTVFAAECYRQHSFTRRHNNARARDPGAPVGHWRDAGPAAAGLARESFRQAQALAFLVSLGLLFAAFQPVVAARAANALMDGWIGPAGAVGLVGAITASTWLGRFEKLPPWLRKALLLVAAALVGPVLLWGGGTLLSAEVALHGGIWSNADLGRYWPIEHAAFVDRWLAALGPTWLALIYAAAMLVLAALLWTLNLHLYNANDVSPHSHYRDKLAATFLFSANLADRNTVTSRSELMLSEMDTATAPFALINAALNFADRSEYRGRGRNSTFFTFSPLHAGSTEVGYMPSRELEKVNRRFKLSSAVAVSGAAASANMGRNTNPALRFLLALVNVRLGYWLPNPRIVAEGSFNRSLFYAGSYPQPGAWQLLREMLGNLDTGTAFINLSDGGHLENLGVYELIRRRCRVIIAIDAEQDGDLNFRSLGDLVRFARIDRAVNIDIDVAAIRPGADKLSRRHFAIGRIDYGRGAYGWLVYVKNSLTGREGESIRKYKAIEPDFPHHDTVGDQFFDEEQFEAYRELGYQMITETFAGWRAPV
jgi:hypothetical protein